MNGTLYYTATGTRLHSVVHDEHLRSTLRFKIIYPAAHHHLSFTGLHGLLTPHASAFGLYDFLEADQQHVLPCSMYGTPHATIWCSHQHTVDLALYWYSRRLTAILG